MAFDGAVICILIEFDRAHADDLSMQDDSSKYR